MTNVLVTGASGFIGSHLVEALARRGDRVRCLVRGTSQLDALRSWNVEFCTADLDGPADLESALAGVDVVYHLAGRVAAHRRTDLYRVNRDGTERLAQACAAQRTPPTLIVVSSVAAAGPVARDRCRDEAHRPAPVSHYGASKRAGELAAARYARQVPTTIVRPGIVFGPRCRETLPIFQAIAALRLHIVPSFASPPLSLINVTDLVELLMRAADAGKRLEGVSPQSDSGIYFACHPERPTYEQWGHLIAEAMGAGRILALPLAEPLPWLVAAAVQAAFRLQGRSHAVSIDKMREALVGSWACSGQRAERELGYNPNGSLVEQLRATAQWYRAHGWLPDVAWGLGWHNLKRSTKASAAERILPECDERRRPWWSGKVAG